MRNFLSGMVVAIGLTAVIAYASPRDLDTVIPKRNEDDCIKPGIFADEPCYPETILKLMDYVDHRLEIHNAGQDAEVDLTAYGKSVITMTEGFDVLADYIKSTDHTNLDNADWAGGAPDTVWEAIDRLAKAYNASHTGPVP